MATTASLLPPPSPPPETLPLPVRIQAPYVSPQSIPHGAAVEIDKFGVGQWGQGGDYFGTNAGPDAPAPGDICQVQWEGPCEALVLPGELFLKSSKLYNDPLLSPNYTTVDPGGVPVRGIVFDKWTYATNGLVRALMYWTP
jgi:hypothetical protein